MLAMAELCLAGSFLSWSYWFLCFIHNGYLLFFFFFQAEDGIRDLTVTGVQTCALPISARRYRFPSHSWEVTVPSLAGTAGSAGLASGRAESAFLYGKRIVNVVPFPS